MAADFHVSNPASNLESRALRVPHPLPQAGPVVGRELVAGVSQVVGMGRCGDRADRTHRDLAILSEVTPIEWPVRTERLSLRGYTRDDLAALWAYEQLPQVQHWLGWAPRTRDELRDAMEDKSSNTTHVMVRLASTVIGHVMVMPRDSWAQTDVAIRAEGLEAELGWMFDPTYGGQGYATEAVRATIELCFDQLKLRRVHAGCFADNTASWRLMERLGLRREEHSRSTALHRDGTWHDGFTYALLREEWLTSP